MLHGPWSQWGLGSFKRLECIASPSRCEKRSRSSFGDDPSGQWDTAPKVHISNTRILNRSLVVLDRALSTLLGRPCILQDEESALHPHYATRKLTFRSFDADLPLTCDDEELECDLKLPLQPDRPTQMSSFVCTIRLSQILAFALRTVVSRRSFCAFPH